MARREFTTWEVQASYKVNTLLARALFNALSYGEYDRYTAHTWALRVINAAPKSPVELAAAIMNFDYMADAGVAKYEANKIHQKRCNEAFSAFIKWNAKQKEAA